MNQIGLTMLQDNTTLSIIDWCIKPNEYTHKGYPVAFITGGGLEAPLYRNIDIEEVY